MMTTDPSIASAGSAPIAAVHSSAQEAPLLSSAPSIGNTQETPALIADSDDSKLENAATKIQSAYRGYQARRELYGPPLTTSQKWKHLIDYSRIQHIHKMHAHEGESLVTHTEGSLSHDCKINSDGADDQQLTSPTNSNPSRARLAWRRAEFLGSRLGKGSSGVSDEEALVLLTEHWLEMSDKHHRYGSNLKHYHAHWLKQETNQNFFYWLDKGDGKDVDLENRPRADLNSQRVQYLQDHERPLYAVEIVEGMLYFKHSGKPVHTYVDSVEAGDEVDVSEILPENCAGDDEATSKAKKPSHKKVKFIYVTDTKGTLYVAQKRKGSFHHSSFLGGGTVCAAGAIAVNNGQLIKINPNSGHYQPGQPHFERLLKTLEEQGISMEKVKVSFGRAVRQGSIDVSQQQTVSASELEGQGHTEP